MSNRRWCALVLLTLGAVSVLAVPAVRADGGEIAYVDNDGATIRLVQADGSEDRRILIAAGGIGALAWGPDGNVRAYTSGPRPTQRVFEYDVAAGKQTELKTGVQTSGPVAFFPDGKRLAAISAPRTLGFPMCGDSQILTIDLTAVQTRRVCPPAALSGFRIRPTTCARSG